LETDVRFGHQMNVFYTRLKQINNFLKIKKLTENSNQPFHTCHPWSVLKQCDWRAQSYSSIPVQECTEITPQKWPAMTCHMKTASGTNGHLKFSRDCTHSMPRKYWLSWLLMASL